MMKAKAKASARSTMLADAIAAVVFFLIWAVLYGIANFLLGWLFRGTFTRILWFMASVGSFMLCVVLPVYHVHVNGKVGGTAKVVKPRTLDTDDTEEQPDCLAVSRETAVMRQSLVADINACLADSSCIWQWSNSSSLSRIYLFPCGNKTVTYAGTLNVVNGRVESVSVVADGKTQLFYNNALLSARREEKKRIETPVIEFLRKAVPDAQWSWEDADAGVIILTSAKLGVCSVPAKLRRKADGHISSMDVPMPDGNIKNVKNRAASVTETQTRATRKATEKHSKKAAETQGADSTVAKVMDSKTRSTMVSNKKPAQAVDVLPTADETNANLLQTTDVPPVDEDVLKRAAYQLADYDALEISHLAITAEESGETYFVRHWPEGIQTKLEAEYYAEAIISKGDFEKADIDAETQTIRFYLCIQDLDEEA